MAVQYILSEYMDLAMAEAVYDKGETTFFLNESKIGPPWRLDTPWIKAKT